MKKLFILIFSIVIAGELEVDGDVKVSGSVVFQDSSSINTAPKDLPIGILFPYAGTAPPNGWMLCNGQEVSRGTYSNLFAVIGDSYGIGDGSTTFSLPDLRGRMPMGLDNMGGNSADRVANSAADSIGGNAGEEMHQLTVEELASHDHIVNNVMGAHSGQGNNQGGNHPNASPSPSPATTTSTGENQAHNNMPPYLSLNYIIKY